MTDSDKSIFTKSLKVVGISVAALVVLCFIFSLVSGWFLHTVVACGIIATFISAVTGAIRALGLYLDIR